MPFARCWKIFSAVWPLLLGANTRLFAQAGAWPEYPLNTTGDPHALERGPGGYLSPIKLGLLLLVYLLWIKTTDWVNRDCQLLRLSYSVWNAVLYVGFLVGFALAITIPVFPAGFALLVVSWLGPLLAYVIKRNSTVDPHERVLTPSHIRHVLADALQSMGVKVASEKKAAYEKGAPVQFTATAGTPVENQADMVAARQSPGYLPAKEVIAEMTRQRADKCMLDYSRDAVTVRFQIDGVWHEADTQDRETGDEMLFVFKKLSHLNPKERRQRQSGRFAVEFEKKKYTAILVSQGTQTGERVILQLIQPAEHFQSLRDLGMREKTEERLKELLSSDHGFVLFSAPPGGGLSTTTPLALQLLDRYLRDVVAVEDIRSPEPLAENVELFTYDISKGDKPEKLLETVLRREPEVVVVPDLINATIAQMLCNAAEKRLVISTVRAKEAVEALLRVLLLKVPAAPFANTVQGVLNQRLIRRLCEECRQPYEPAPQLLQKLGIPPGRVEYLYRPPDPAEQDKVCERCNGIGYYGRTAIFELLIVDDKIRAVLAKQPKLDVLRKVSRQAGNRNLQQEGIVLVAQGITSVQELSRVLKQ